MHRKVVAYFAQVGSAVGRPLISIVHIIIAVAGVAPAAAGGAIDSGSGAVRGSGGVRFVFITVGALGF